MTYHAAKHRRGLHCLPYGYSCKRRHIILPPRYRLLDPSKITSLNDIIDVFSCCIFTWSVLTTLLPAFVLAGAISAFVPRTTILKYLGAGASRFAAYGTAAASGMVLSLCSCNIVPLFVSIYRRGAGLGPACTFLYAGPAINIVSMILVFKLLGWQMGLTRALAVPLVAVLLGVLMSLVFRSRERARQETIAQVAVVDEDEDGRRSLVLFLLLLGTVAIGAIKDPWYVSVGGIALIGAVAAWYFARRFSFEEFKEWMAETWGLVKLVVPWLVPAVLVIGFLAQSVDARFVMELVGDDTLRSVVLADLFGALMYFPILSEVLFVRTFISFQMTLGMGPALAILLTGAGLSLPGAIILGQAVGWRLVIAYLVLVIVLTTAAAALFASQVGQFMCECMLPG